MAIDRREIAIVGCGPGSPLYLTDAARQAVARADVLVGSKRLLELFAGRDCERIVVDADLGALIEKIAALHAAGRKVAVLVSGDPGLYSLARNVIARFGIENCGVVPAVSSVQVAFARVGLDWADARIVSAHGRVPEIAADEWRRCDKLAVLAGTAEAVHWAAGVARVVCASHAVFLCENLTLDDEQVRQVTPEQLDAIRPSSLSIVLLIRRSLIA